MLTETEKLAESLPPLKGRTWRIMFVPESIDQIGRWRVYSENDKDIDDYIITYSKTLNSAIKKMLKTVKAVKEYKKRHPELFSE